MCRTCYYWLLGAIIAAIVSYNVAFAQTIVHPDDLRGMRVLSQGQCVDHESGAEGYCFAIQGPDSLYVVFHEYNGRVGAPIFMRKRWPQGGGYDTIWYQDGTPPKVGIPL